MQNRCIQGKEKGGSRNECEERVEEEISDWTKVETAYKVIAGKEIPDIVWIEIISEWRDCWISIIMIHKSLNAAGIPHIVCAVIYILSACSCFDVGAVFIGAEDLCQIPALCRYLWYFKKPPSSETISATWAWIQILGSSLGKLYEET